MTKIGYYEGKHVKNNVFNFLEDHIARNPHKVALKWVKTETLKSWTFDPLAPLKHEEMNFLELTKNIRHVAAGYEDLGIKYGDRVILFLPMSPALYTSMFALQMIGAIPVFLDSWARRAHLGVSAQVVTPTAMISFERAFELCADVPELADLPIKICVGDSQKKYTARLEDLLQNPRNADIAPVEREHTALITFTTGSSGVPKGANRTHRFLAAQHYALDKSIPYAEQDCDLPVFPIFSLNNIAAGVTTVIPAIDVGSPSEKDNIIFLGQIKSAGVNCITLSPSLFNGLSAYAIQKGLSIASLRRTVTGGAPVSLDNVKDFSSIAPQSEIWILYGSTEVEPMADIEGKEMIALSKMAPTDPEIVEEGVNVGHIVNGLEYKFIHINKGPVEVHKADDWKKIEVSKNQVGELIVAGEHVCREYYNNADAFKKSKILDERGVVWHRTGDLGRLSDTGHLWIVGRIHNAIHRKGQYVFPVRAEIILKRFPFIRLGAYLGIPQANGDEITACVVVPQNLASLTDEAQKISWKAEIERVMKKNNLPVDSIYFREKIPMDPRHHSKVEYDVLRKELADEKS